MLVVETPVNRYASHKVFNISELVDLICNFLGKKHCSRLMHTSRRFYRSTIAVVWKKADLISLLLLIPGTLIQSIASDDDDDNPDIKLQLPTQLDWTRFNIYGPFVKYLRATPLYDCDEFPDHPTHALLPNLQHISSNVLGFRYLKRLGLIPRVLSPALLSFQLVRENGEEPPSLDRQSSFDLMHNLSEHCPSFQELAIYPEVREEGIPTGLGPFYNYVSKMANLRSLACSGWILHHESALQRLGQLPLLGELTLTVETLPESLPSDLRSFAVSEESFPALRHLDIQNLDPPTISYLCTLKPLVRNITKLCIVYAYSYETTSDDEVSEEDRSNNVLLSLAQTSPQLTDLKLHTQGDYGDVHISTPVLEVFKTLHLLRLDLGFVELRSQIQWEQFGAALPHLQELILKQQPLTFRRLGILAHALPNLRLMVLHSLLPVPSVPSHQIAGQKPDKHLQHVIIRAKFTLKGGSGEMVGHIARYLHNLWPNCVWEPQESDLEEERLELKNLNRVISDLRSRHIN